jgi:hypothetical protein
VGLWIGALRTGGELIKEMMAQDAEVVARFPGLLLLDNAFGAISICLVLACAWLLATRSRVFKQVYVAYFAWIVIGPALSILLAVGVLYGVYDTSIGIGAAFNTMGISKIGQWIGGAIGSGLWLLYVFRSRRVAVTCIR